MFYLLKALDSTRCAYVGIKVVDTIRDECSHVIDRNNLIVVQTPQGLYRNDYLEAYEKYLGDMKLTDDISYLEAYFNYKPEVVLGSRLNFKITTPEDVKMAEWLINSEDFDD